MGIASCLIAAGELMAILMAKFILPVQCQQMCMEQMDKEERCRTSTIQNRSSYS